MRSNTRREKTRQAVKHPLWYQIQQGEREQRRVKHELATLRANIATRLYQLSIPTNEQRSK